LAAQGIRSAVSGDGADQAGLDWGLTGVWPGLASVGSGDYVEQQSVTPANGDDRAGVGDGLDET